MAAEPALLFLAGHELHLCLRNHFVAADYRPHRQHTYVCERAQARSAAAAEAEFTIEMLLRGIRTFIQQLSAGG